MLGILAPTLLGLDGPEFVMRIQSISADFWTIDHLETILAQAFVYEKAASLLPGPASGHADVASV
jgi:hypothetical protein